MPYIDAENHLKFSDAKLKKVIENIGPCTLKHNKREKFDVLVSSIIGQQLSAKAASTIKGRVVELVCQKNYLNAESFENIKVAQLRNCGLSNAKSRYILDLAKNTINGELNLKTIHKLTDDEIIKMLINQKGVGMWTAEMFMIFALGRPDILSTTDAGLLRSAQYIYKLQDKPTVEKFTRIAEKWKPYRSIASWYLWRLID